MGTTADNEGMVNYRKYRNNGSMRPGGSPMAEGSKREPGGKVIG